MEQTHYRSLAVTFFWVAIFFVHSSSMDSPPPIDTSSGVCVLNFTYPYQPTGECMKRSQETIEQWGSIRTTLCCRNALTALSEALALRVHNAQPPEDPTIFIEQDAWNNCTGPFARQPSVNANDCGFGGFFYGSNTSYCSNLTMQDVIKQGKAYQNAVSVCNTSFDDFNGVCSKCTGALLSLRDELLSKSGEDSDKKNEEAMCAVASVVSILAATLDNRSRTDDFFRCLLMLDKLDALAQVVVAILVAVTTILLIIMLIKYVGKKKITLKRGKSNQNVTSWSGLYRFSMAEIENAINYGNERKSLGRGSAGQVYKGVLPSGQAVAIKHIYPNNQSDSFHREVQGLSRIRHPNLVCLFGFCMEDDCHYLVYEYCSGGNLAQQLLKKDTSLTWDKRVKILRDCAVALRYLHRFIDGCIVHRDIKLTNILLTEELEPKLSDFGLAKMLNMEESKVFTDVRGTIGYMDPEYMSNAKLTCASDIYSFGIVCLQILSGQKVIELNLDASDQLTRKARDVSLGNRPLEDFEDPRLKGKINKADFKSILSIAVLCVAKSSQDRPSIDIVVNELDKAWRNTHEYKRMKKRKQGPSSTSSTTAASPSLEVITA
ncbi:Serine/threonine protein kinase [Trema orientale]|uniref:Serine/threonine protein kinase n=1 Tax=Trema orientale TaxID=63057 RepID=A0A2P5FYV6_TREOI|nr:Serine/threonine protein kinase [Trema orientale]